MYAYLDTDKNREMSILLHEKGCVSESGLYWSEWATGWKLVYWTPENYEYYKSYEGHAKGGLIPITVIPAFTFEDVIRRETAQSIWPEKHKVNNMISIDITHPNGAAVNSLAHMWQIQTYWLLDYYQTDQDWQQEVINTLKKLKK